jgi:hypothetical protein
MPWASRTQDAPGGGSAPNLRPVLLMSSSATSVPSNERPFTTSEPLFRRLLRPRLRSDGAAAGIASGDFHGAQKRPFGPRRISRVPRAPSRGSARNWDPVGREDFHPRVRKISHDRAARIASCAALR